MTYRGPYLAPYRERHESTLRVARAVQCVAEAKALGELHLRGYLESLTLSAEAQRLLALELDVHSELHKPITDEDMAAWRETGVAP